MPPPSAPDPVPKTTGAPASTAKLAAIRALVSAGYALIPLRGKTPVDRDWGSTLPGAYDPAQLAAGANYGVVLTAADLVVDVDPRNFAKGDNPVKRLREKIGDPLRSFAVKTGGGGYHIYFKKSVDVLVRNSLGEFPGVEFKAGPGRQVVGPGSLHPETNAEYVIAQGSPAEVAEVPAALLELVRRTEVPFSDVEGVQRAYTNDAATQGRFVDYLHNAAEPSVEGKNGDLNAFKVAAVGRDFGLPPGTTLELMLEVWNRRCAPPWSPEELRVKVVNAYRYAQGAPGASSPKADFSAVTAEKALKEPEPDVEFLLGPQGRVVRCFKNLVAYLRLPEAGLAGIFGYNEFTGRVEFTNPAPWHRGQMPRFRGVGDFDLKLLKGHLAIRHRFEAAVSEIEEAITNVAHARRFHPVREYLESLTWDGKPRLDLWLTDYLGVEDAPYVRACARKTLCAAVMRAFKPGVKFDHVLLLEGSQGIGKSSVVKILGGEWAADAPVDPHSKDTVDMMQGRWIIEMAELEVARKTDEDALKAFLSRDFDLARLAYGRMTREFPRQSIFIGTKNPNTEGTYLKDETGGRRWWPVRCGQVDFKGLKTVRDQLFAEAVARMRTAPGEKLYMDTPELTERAREEVGKRFIDDPWMERVAMWLNEHAERDFVTSRDVFIEAIGGSDQRFDRRAQLSIAKCLKALNWGRGGHRVEGRLCKGFWRPHDSALVTELL